MKALQARMRTPAPGDVVIETSCFTSIRGIDLDSVGKFIDRPWDMDHPDGPNQDPCHYLWRVESLLDGRVHTWGNADFVALPIKSLRDEIERAVLEEAKGKGSEG